MTNRILKKYLFDKNIILEEDYIKLDRKEKVKLLEKIFTKTNTDDFPGVCDYELVKEYIWTKYDVVQISEMSFNCLNYGDAKHGFAAYTSRDFINIYALEALINNVWRKLLVDFGKFNRYHMTMIPKQMFAITPGLLNSIIRYQSCRTLEYRLNKAKAQFRCIELFTDDYDPNTIADDVHGKILYPYYFNPLAMSSDGKLYRIKHIDGGLSYSSYYKLIPLTKEFIMGSLIQNREDICRGITLPDNVTLKCDEYSNRLYKIKGEGFLFVRKQYVYLPPRIEERVVNNEEYKNDEIYFRGVVDNKKKKEIIDTLSSNINQLTQEELYNLLDSLNDYFILKVVEK